MSNYVTFQPVQMHRNILVSLAPVQMGRKVILCDNNPSKIRGRFDLWDVKGWCNGLLHDLWVTAKIRSLPEIKLPIFTDEDTNTDKLQKTILYEWGTARLELEILLGDTLGNWASFGETAIKNSNGYRYRKHRVLDMITDSPGFQLEEGFKIAAQLINVGFGDLTSSDTVDILGAWTQEFIAIQSQPPYVINNVYGSSGSSPSPTPTPTPVVEPTFSLSLAQGKTSADANSDDTITLTITNFNSDKSLGITWVKDGVATTITESVSNPISSPILLSTLKLKVSGAGSYSLSINYNSKVYTTNAVAVVLAPKVTATITANSVGDTSFFVVNGQSYDISVSGSGFVAGAATFAWFKDDVAATISDSPNTPVPITGNLTISNNGSFTLDKASAKATFSSMYETGDKKGQYKIKITQGGVTTVSNAIWGAHKLVDPYPSASSFSMSASGSLTVSISGLVVGNEFSTVWLKNGVEIPATEVQRVYAENGGSAYGGYYFTFALAYTAFATAPFTGAGTYKLRVKVKNTPITFTSSYSSVVSA